MATLSIGGKTLFTQSGSAEPVLSSDLTGTLGSGIVFPAGHIIQTVVNTYHSSESDAYSGTTAFEKCNNNDSSYHWSGSINNVKANSHVKVEMSFRVHCDNTGRQDVGYSLAIYRENTIINIGSNTTFNSANYIYHSALSNGNNNYREQRVLNFLDTSPATGTNNYYLGYIVYGSGTVNISSQATELPFQCILQEISQ